MLVDAPVAPPATANTPLASVQTKSTNKIQQNIKFRAKLFQIIITAKGNDAFRKQIPEKRQPLLESNVLFNQERLY